MLILGLAVVAVALAFGFTETDTGRIERNTDRLTRVEALLADHHARLNRNDEDHRNISDIQIERRLTKLETNSTVAIYLLLAVLVALTPVLIESSIRLLRSSGGKRGA